MSMFRYFIYLSFDGTNYHGWQIQENARKQRVEDQKRLEAIKADFNAKYSMPDKK